MHTDLFERTDGSLVFLGELKCCGDLCRVGHNLSIELAAFLHQSLLTFVRFLQSLVEFLVLYTKLFQALVTHELGEHLEISCQS